MRGPAGDLWVGSNVDVSGHVIGIINNFATEKVEGVDLVADYNFDADGYGSIFINNVMAVVTTWDRQQRAGAPVDDCNGVWGGRCDGPQPKVRNNLRVTWATPWSVTASLMWRYIDESRMLATTSIWTRATFLILLAHGRLPGMRRFVRA